MAITPAQVAQITGCSLDDAVTYLPEILHALESRETLNRPTLIAAIATIGVETGGFCPINEYGGIQYFTKMYEGREDLGNHQPGDGVRYHGRGFIQVTGRHNYRVYGQKLGLGNKLEDNPELALDPKISAAILVEYFVETGIPKLAAADDWKNVRRTVNGGLNGWEEFIRLVRECDRILPPVLPTPASNLTSHSKALLPNTQGGKAWVTIVIEPGLCLKRSTAQSITLRSEDRCEVDAGTKFLIGSWLVEENHLKFSLDLPWCKENNFSLGQYNTWYAFLGKPGQPYVLLETITNPIIHPIDTTADSLPATVKLKVPYLFQLDNELNPTGSCNVTSVAMCLAYFGRPVRDERGNQLEDDLYDYCERMGLDRHLGEDLARLVEAYGCKDKFTRKANWDDVKRWLAQGNPCIIHGFFTGHGHIIVIAGYNEKGWIVHDPYGEFFAEGYDTSRSGAGLTYSYGLMNRLCSPDDELWIHFVSKN
jgi:predicted chitinase